MSILRLASVAILIGSAGCQTTPSSAPPAAESGAFACAYTGWYATPAIVSSVDQRGCVCITT